MLTRHWLTHTKQCHKVAQTSSFSKNFWVLKVIQTLLPVPSIFYNQCLSHPAHISILRCSPWTPPYVFWCQRLKSHLEMAVAEYSGFPEAAFQLWLFFFFLNHSHRSPCAGLCLVLFSSFIPQLQNRVFSFSWSVLLHPPFRIFVSIYTLQTNSVAKMGHTSSSRRD